MRDGGTGLPPCSARRLRCQPPLDATLSPFLLLPIVVRIGLVKSVGLLPPPHKQLANLFGPRNFFSSTIEVAGIVEAPGAAGSSLAVGLVVEEVFKDTSGRQSDRVCSI